MEQLEKERHDKYNPNDIFKNRKTEIIQEEIITDNASMVEYKESIFKKIIDRIKNIFHK